MRTLVKKFLEKNYLRRDFVKEIITLGFSVKGSLLL